MLELQHDTLNFSFPEVHPDAKCSISFQRTLRIPDDGKSYPLPPNLGRFPVRHLDDHKDRVPSEWAERGGVLLPMYQSEALWVLFHGHAVSGHGTQYPFAVKVSAGLRSAVTGEQRKDGLHAKDYVVIPKQPWLDGFVVEKGTVRQFVAAPLGMGFTVEEQLTGKAEFGGIQIEVFPMKREAFERRYPKRPPPVFRNDSFRGTLGITKGVYGSSLPRARRTTYGGDSPLRSASIGMAAGGKMKQQIFDDPFDMNDWETSTMNRCFIHLTNSLAWQAITGQAPPHAPATASQYKSMGYPWFDYYKDEVALSGTETMQKVKSVAEMQSETGLPLLPENQSVEVKSTDVKVLTPQGSPKDAVRDGSW